MHASRNNSKSTCRSVE